MDNLILKDRPLGFRHRSSAIYTAACISLTSALLCSCGSGGATGDPGIQGVSKYDFRFSNGAIRLSVVFTELKVDAGATIPLAKPTGSTIEIGPDFNSGGTLFAVTVPVAGLAQLNPIGLPILGLPDGRPIPDVINGALTGNLVNLPLFGLSYLYMSKDVFGIFLPVTLPSINAIVRVKMRDEAGNILGVFYGIPKVGDKTFSGVLVLIPVDGSGLI